MAPSSFQTPVAAALIALALVATWRTADATGAVSRLGAIREAYTTNAICAKKNCINPVFPGMEDLHRLQQAKWISSTLQKTSSHMGFCRNAITYDPALPIPASGGSTVEALVQRQDNAASTMFYYHLTGLGLEAWDYQKPEFANDCIKSVWRMVCFTYFPRAQIGIPEGGYSEYIRPCKSSCQNYVRACGVECCDESVQCVFSHTKAISASQTVTTQGYLPHDGPSSLCTGAARRSAPLGAAFWLIVALVLAITLQGCDYDVPIHRIGNWRGEPDYLIKHEFIPPGGSAKMASINSCSLQRLSQTLQCSGRGVCKMWDRSNMNNHLAFCECDRDWADPECRTKRKSQVVAYLLSIFAGFLGADMFYLGFVPLGLFKLFTFGGFGIWWVVDIIRIGSAPVYSGHYRVAADLPHYAFVLSCTMFALFLGFFCAYNVTTKYRSKKRKEAMLLQLDEDARQKEPSKPFAAAYDTGHKKPTVKMEQAIAAGYGATDNGNMPPTIGPSMPMPTMGGMPPPPTGPMRMPPSGPMPTMGGMAPPGTMPPGMMEPRTMMIP